MDNLEDCREIMEDERRMADVVSQTGEVLFYVDLNDTCKPYEPNDRCGGCGKCLAEQAVYYGSKIKLWYEP